MKKIKITYNHKNSGRKCTVTRFGNDINDMVGWINHFTSIGHKNVKAGWDE